MEYSVIYAMNLAMDTPAEIPHTITSDGSGIEDL